MKRWNSKDEGQETVHDYPDIQRIMSCSLPLPVSLTLTGASTVEPPSIHPIWQWHAMHLQETTRGVESGLNQDVDQQHSWIVEFL